MLHHNDTGQVLCFITRSLLKPCTSSFLIGRASAPTIYFVRLQRKPKKEETCCVDERLSHLPDQRLQLFDFGGQADAEGDGVRAAGDGAGDDGASHGEGQHGVNHKDDE